MSAMGHGTHGPPGGARGDGPAAVRRREPATRGPPGTGGSGCPRRVARVSHTWWQKRSGAGPRQGHNVTGADAPALGTVTYITMSAVRSPREHHGEATMPKYVYRFSEGGMDQKDLLGGKGANLAEMSRLGLPVPPGFTITTEACRAYMRDGRLPPDLRVQATLVLREMEAALGPRHGDFHEPLLVSVRSGAKFSMPGMMETVLNVGLNDASVQGLTEHTGDERFAWDSYRRLIQMFGKTVLDIDGELFARALEDLKAERGVRDDTELTAEDLRGLVTTYKDIVRETCGREFPQHPREQLDMA